MAERGGHDFSIVSEMLDVRNRALAEVTRADDFIVSDKLVSLLLAQVAENSELTAVFADLFDPEGSEIYLKPASDTSSPAAPVDFYTVVERPRSAAARSRSATASSRAAATRRAPTAWWSTRASRSRSTFGAEDRIIVLAED